MGRSEFAGGGRKMTEDLFGERRRALEEEFFTRHNAELLARMRAELEAGHLRDALRDTAGIADESLLAHLVELGITPGTLAALTVAPLISVAWADRKLEELERSQVLRDPEVLGLGQPAHAMLESWLSAEPEPALFEAWADYVRGILPGLDPAARGQLRAKTLARAAAIADAAAGEPYGVGRRTSPEEHAVLKRIAAAFDDAAPM